MHTTNIYLFIYIASARGRITKQPLYVNGGLAASEAVIYRVFKQKRDQTHILNSSETLCIAKALSRKYLLFYVACFHKYCCPFWRIL